MLPLEKSGQFEGKNWRYHPRLIRAGLGGAGCRTGKDVATLSVSYVFRYLLAELATMNIAVTCEL